MKKCKGCNIIKPSENFFKNKEMADGRLSYCKACCKKRYKSSEEQKEKAVAYNKKRRFEVRDKYGLGAGTVSRYGFRTALDVYNKCGRKCVECNSKLDLTIHHKDHNGRNNYEKSLEMNNNIDNLVLLCRSCHGRLHAKKYWQEKAKSDKERK